MLKKVLIQVTAYFWRRGWDPRRIISGIFGRRLRIDIYGAARQHIGEFDEGCESWPQYAKRLKHFLKANKVTNEEQKTSTFLSVIGPDTFKLLGPASDRSKVDLPVIEAKQTSQ